MQPGEVMQPGGDGADRTVPVEIPVAPAEMSPAQAPPTEEQTIPAISWTASEYIDRPKDTSWYMMFAVGLVIVVAVIYLLTRDVFTAAMLGIGGLAFGVFSGRRPEVQTYALDDRGITIGRKFYSYHDFKTYSLMDEGAFQSIMLLPLKRFMPPLSIYFDPKDQDAIIQTLADYLPFEQRKHDPIDQLTRRLRF